MIASMAGEEQVVYHDFFGIAGQRPAQTIPDTKVLKPVVDLKKASQNIDQEREPVLVTNIDRYKLSSPPVLVSAKEQLSSPQATGLVQQIDNSRQSKRKDILFNSRDFIPQLSSVPNTDFSPLLKVSRVERQDEWRNRVIDYRDDVSTMNPPRLLANCQNINVTLAGITGQSSIHKKWDNAKPAMLNPGIVFNQMHINNMNLQSEKVLTSNSRENTMVIPRPPADEGSRTGLKVSCNSNLQRSSPGISPQPKLGANNPPEKPKTVSKTTSSDPANPPLSQQTPSVTSRQLTIFYGGQAHVFDDVPSDKVDAIMTLAGSSGRSWSTTYSTSSKAGVSSGGQTTSEKHLESLKGTGNATYVNVNNDVPAANKTSSHQEGFSFSIGNQATKSSPAIARSTSCNTGRED